MQPQSYVVLALLTVLALGSCGGEEPAERAPEGAEPALTLHFVLDFDRAASRGRFESGSERGVILHETLRIIRERLKAAGLARATVTPAGDDEFDVALPVGEEDAAGELDGVFEEVVRLVTAPGDLAFRVEVRPREAYEGFRGGTAPRLEEPPYPWAGAEGFEATAEGFERFKEHEVARYVKAGEAKTAYVPSDARYRVAPRHATDASSVDEFLVLEEPEDETYRFDQDMLENAVVSVGPSGRPVVLYDVKTAYQNAFGSWTQANIGLPLAIVVAGEVHTAPVVQDRLTSNVQISLGTERSYAETKLEAEQLAAVLGAGRLWVPPTLESVTWPFAREEK